MLPTPSTGSRRRSSRRARCTCTTNPCASRRACPRRALASTTSGVVCPGPRPHQGPLARARPARSGPAGAVAVPIRSRTATSTGMRDVVRAADVPASNVYRWRPVLQAQFDITTGDLEAANRGLAAHEAAIARAQMRSNCHGGWSCKEVALAKLRDMSRGARRLAAAPGRPGGPGRRGRRPGAGAARRHGAEADAPSHAGDRRRKRTDGGRALCGPGWPRRRRNFGSRAARCRPLPPLDAHGHRRMARGGEEVLWGERGSSRPSSRRRRRQQQAPARPARRPCAGWRGLALARPRPRPRDEDDDSPSSKRPRRSLGGEAQARTTPGIVAVHCEDGW